MTTLFISDLHLDASRPQIVELFAQFMASEGRDADAVYILGDLFETWIGDDDDSDLAHAVVNILAPLSHQRVPVYFIAGNRDFLLGPEYAARCGMQVLDDGSVVDLHDTPTLLMHGDTLCTDDEAYQAFRAEVRAPAWQRHFLAQPLHVRREFAHNARARSVEHTGRAASAIMDVNQQAVLASMRKYGVQHLIHGHTHRPAVHALQLDGLDAQRVVLGDWYEQGSVLRVNAGNRRLSALPTEPTDAHAPGLVQS